MLKGVQHNWFSRTSVNKLLNKIDCSSVSTERKIEAVHDLLEQQHPLYLLAVCSADCTKAWQKVSQSGLELPLGISQALVTVVLGTAVAKDIPTGDTIYLRLCETVGWQQ